MTYTSWRPRSTPPRAHRSRVSQRLSREFHEALLDANAFEDLAGKWQAAVLEAEQNRPKLQRILDGSSGPPVAGCANTRSSSCWKAERWK